MYKGSLSTVLTVLLYLQQASSSVIYTADGSIPIDDIVKISHADTVPGLNNIADSIISNSPSTINGLDGAVKANLVRREDPPELGELDRLAKWLTNTPVRADCVFVTVAHLLGTTPEEVSRRTNVPIPQPGEGGTPEMLTILSKLGLVFRVWTYGSLPQGGGGPTRTRPLHPGGPLYVAFPRATGMPRTMGVAYYLPDASGNIRPDGNGEVIGHVVVCTNPGTPYARYIDYQADPNGRDITESMRNTRIAAYFSIDPNASTGDLITTQRPAIEQMEVDEEQAHSETQNDEPQLERPPTLPQDTSEPMDVDSDNSDEPMDVDEATLEDWRHGQFGNIRCAVAIAALAALSNNKFGRSLSELSLRTSNQEEDCRRARKMANKTPSQGLPSCSKVNMLEIGFQLADKIWAGTYDYISVAFAAEKDKKSQDGQHQRLKIADTPSAGLHVWKPVDLKKFFNSSSVALRDINYVGLYDYSIGLGISGDRWEFQGLKLRGQCVGNEKQVEVDKFASVNKYLQHSNKNKGNPWIIQIPFAPKVYNGRHATAELVWAGNMTVNDWKATGVRGEKQEGEKETAQFCFSEGGSAECDEGSDRDKYTKRIDQAS
ncbi:hypothetical protein ACQRIU_006329 [Beauveria bassiana]